MDAAIEAFAGTGRPFIPISGLWIYGENTSISEESPLKAPALGERSRPALLDIVRLVMSVDLDAVAVGVGPLERAPRIVP